MNVLIVESKQELGKLWQRHLERQGASVQTAHSQESAILALYRDDVDVIVLDLVLDHGSALAVADFASYRRPEARVIVMTAKRPRNPGGTGRHPLAPALVCRHEVDTGAWRHRCGQPSVYGV